MLEIRKELTMILQKIGDNPDLSPHLRAMRAACRKFMNEAGDQTRPQISFRDFEVFAALGELRAIFGIHIAQLAVKYGINVEDDLATILPVEDTEGKISRI